MDYGDEPVWAAQSARADEDRRGGGQAECPSAAVISRPMGTAAEVLSEEAAAAAA